MSSATKSNPSLWKRIVARVKAQASHGTAAGQWSGRKAQAAVKAYKKAGGGYKGGKKSSNSLSKWSKQKWRTKSGKKSSDTGERYLPEKAIKNLSSKEYAKTSAKKRQDKASGKQFSKQPKSIARKVRRFRKV
jgi:hypothetical protein|tara:strand:- start:10440 stop:10838 length:399 start_codon:yes stop_codon:yes gene_type:complete